jgi:hypothetical protein
MGTQAPAKSTPRLSETHDKFLTRRGEKGTKHLARWRGTQQRLVPRASLRSARVAAGFRLSFEVVEFRQFRPAA